MMRYLRAGLLVGLVGALLPAGAEGAGSSPVPTTPPAPEAPRKTPAEEAKDHYNAGLSMRDRAAKLEAKAKTVADEKKRAKYETKTRRIHARSIEEFTLATRKDPRFHQAFSSLGYALRRTGDYTGSLAAYDRALALAPDYSEAIEYRAEACLGLDRLEEAKQAYINLFTADRARADLLLMAMKGWIETRGAGRGGVGPETVEAFRLWIEQRAEIARNTPALSRLEKPKW